MENSPSGIPVNTKNKKKRKYKYLCIDFIENISTFALIYLLSMYKPLFNKRKVLVFHQFQRKGYSLFACLGREVVISVLSVATLSAAKADGISDETWRADSTAMTDREVMLGGVCVTGSRAPLTVSQAARMVTVLSRDDIAQAPVQSVNDLLKMAVGVDVRQRGPLGSQTDISIRGGTQEQITILLNGINICDPQTAHNTLDLPCNLSDIVRIEVLEGPAGRIYGTSSLVGAINIVTEEKGMEDEARPHFSSLVNMEGGSYGYAKAVVGTKLSSQPSSFSSHLSKLSASYTRSDGYSRSRDGHPNTDFSGSKLFYQSSYHDSLINLTWHLGLADKGWGAGTFYATPRWQADEQYEHTTKFYSAIQGENRQGAVHIHSAVYWNQNYDRYEGYRGRPDMMKYNYNRCNIYGIKLSSYFDWAAGRTAFGAEFRDEDLTSSNLGSAVVSPALGIDRSNISAYMEHNVLLHRLTLSAGFVATKDSWSGMGMNVYPGIDISYRLLPGNQLKLFSSYNTSLRLPSFTEMYYRLQGYAADPYLKPEKMQALELGAQYGCPTLQAKISTYYHHGRDMIDWIMDTTQGDQAVWQSVNHTKINTYGLEASTTVNLHAILSPSASHRPPLTLHLSYSYINQDKEAQPGIVSQYALEYLRHKLVARLHATLWRNLHLTLNYRWQDRVGTYTNFSGQVSDYRPFALLDAQLQWTAHSLLPRFHNVSSPQLTLYAKANNVLNNRSYVDFGNVPQPGTWIIFGMLLHWPT